MSDDKKSTAAKTKSAKADQLDEKSAATETGTPAPGHEKQAAEAASQDVAQPVSQPESIAPNGGPEATGHNDEAAPKEVGAADSAGSVSAPQPPSREVKIYPLRTYLDAGEIKRRAGPSYTAPRRHAEALIARGLASTEKPKA